MSAIETLREIVDTHGPIATVRVSSAQAHGRAKQYAYWGAVRYQIRLTAAGVLTHTACGRASSDRRTYFGAAKDAVALAERTGRLFPTHDRIGRVSEPMAAEILRLLSARAMEEAA